MVHLKIMRDIMIPEGVKLIFNDVSLLDRFMLTVKLLKTRCEQKVSFGEQVKTGSVVYLILEEVNTFLTCFSQDNFEEKCIDYLNTKDKDLMLQEDIRSGSVPQDSKPMQRR